MTHLLGEPLYVLEALEVCSDEAAFQRAVAQLTGDSFPASLITAGDENARAAAPPIPAVPSVTSTFVPETPVVSGDAGQPRLDDRGEKPVNEDRRRISERAK